MQLDETKLQTLRHLAITPGDTWPNYIVNYGFTDTDVPALLKLYGDKNWIGSETDSLEFQVLNHSWRILGQLHCDRAIEPLIASFDNLSDKPMALTELSGVFAMIGPKAIEPFAKYLQQPGNDNQSSYSLALDALYEIARAFPNYRNEIIAIWQRYMARPRQSMPRFNGLLITCLIDLGAKEAISDIRKLYALNCVDERYAGDLESVEIKLGYRTKQYSPLPNPHSQTPAALKPQPGLLVNDDSLKPEDDSFNIIDHWLMLLGTDKSIPDVSELDGYFAAIVCAPTAILPSVWMPAIWGGDSFLPAWESDEAAERFTQAVFDLYNSVRNDLRENSFEPVFLENTKDMTALPFVNHWCQGFIRGLVLWPQLLSEDRLFLNKCILPIQTFGTEQGVQSLDTRRIEEFARLQQDITPNVLKLYRHFNNIENHEPTR